MAIWKLKTVQRPYKSGGEWISSVARICIDGTPKIKEAAVIAIADENG
jgi:hypothetical protein